MSQEFCVLCCYSCDTFQVHQVKKSSKWQCKLCGSKQSIKEVFAKGTGADCRKYVQSMNLLKGQKREQLALAAGNESSCHTESHLPTSSDITNSKLEHSESTWTVFLDDANEGAFCQGDHEKMSSTHLESIKSVKRKSNDCYHSNLNTKSFKKIKGPDYLSREEPAHDENWVHEKSNSPKSVGNTASATPCESPATFMQKSNASNEFKNVLQNNEQKIASSSKWYKYVENS